LFHGDFSLVWNELFAAVGDSNQSLPFPPRLVGDLLDWRQEVFEDAARAEVDISVDLHADDEHVTPVQVSS